VKRHHALAAGLAALVACQGAPRRSEPHHVSAHRATVTGRRAACAFEAGALPRDTLALDAPLGAQIPIDHFVVVMQENRSFDHYFQTLRPHGRETIDRAPRTYESARSLGSPLRVRPFRTTDPCLTDVAHDWASVRRQIDDERMDGFAATAAPDGRRAMSFYDAGTLGYYHALARTFAIGDRYFSSVPGPTYPNRMFFLSATSFGHTENTPPPPRDEERTLFHQLEAKGLSWAVYSDGRTFEENVYPRLHAEKGDHFRSLAAYFDEAAQGRLPFFSWVESSYGGPDATDEHAPGNIQLGQAFVARVVAALMQSSAWPRSALLLTYDEHGGFFDHVPPPSACRPDENPPHGAGVRAGEQFDRLGVRVPLIVVSPFARPHFVSHRTYSHTSLLRLVQARADLPALTRRDANDEPPFDLFDFAHPAFVVPPRLPLAIVDPVARARCVGVSQSE
jgi:phospholipase C